MNASDLTQDLLWVIESLKPLEIQQLQQGEDSFRQKISVFVALHVG